MIAELRRRHVFRIGAAYVVVAWLLAQVADLGFESFDAPGWVMRSFLLVLALGFPLALVVAWAFELTPDGIKFDAGGRESRAGRNAGDRRLDFIIIAALSLIVVYLGVDRFATNEPPSSAEAFEQRRSLAVLPFINRSEGGENSAFFADGIHDELLTRLAKISDLRVTSRTSVLEYRDAARNLRQIAAELGVGSILEGGVQRAGDRVRINVQLIDAVTDEHLWAESYESDLTAANIFSIQGQIAASIATALRAQLTEDEARRIQSVPTRNLEALEAYYRGRQLLDYPDDGTVRQAVTHFERAIEIEPGFALGYVGLADAWLLAPTHVADLDLADAHETAARAAQRALDIDPDLPDALAVDGWQRLLQDYDWAGAEDRLQRAIEIEPSNARALHWYSHLLAWKERYADAIRMSERATASDPLSVMLQAHRCEIYLQAGRADDGLEFCERSLERKPNPLLMRILYVGYLELGRADAAAGMLLTWAEATGRDLDAARSLAAALTRFGRAGPPIIIDEALFRRIGMIESVVAVTYAFVGDSSMALSMLERAIEGRYGQIGLLATKRNPVYRFIADDPRFIELIELIGPPA